MIWRGPAWAVAVFAFVVIVLGAFDDNAGAMIAGAISAALCLVVLIVTDPGRRR